jgi:hypothetical protein
MPVKVKSSPSVKLMQIKLQVTVDEQQAFRMVAARAGHTMAGYAHELVRRAIRQDEQGRTDKTS